MAMQILLTSSPASPRGASGVVHLARPRGGAFGGQLWHETIAAKADDDALVAAMIRDATLRQSAGHPQVVTTLEISRQDDSLVRVCELPNVFTVGALVDAANAAKMRINASLAFSICASLARLLAALDAIDSVPAVLSPDEVGLTTGGDVVLLPMAVHVDDSFVAPEILRQDYRPRLSAPVWVVGRMLRVLLATSEVKGARPRVSPKEVERVRPILVELLSPRRSRRPNMLTALAKLEEVAGQLGVSGKPASMVGAFEGLSFALPPLTRPHEMAPSATAAADPNVVLYSVEHTREEDVPPRIDASCRTGFTTRSEQKFLCGVRDAELLATATLDGSVLSPFSSAASQADDIDSFHDLDLSTEGRDSSEGGSTKAPPEKTELVDLEAMQTSSSERLHESSLPSDDEETVGILGKELRNEKTVALQPPKNLEPALGHLEAKQTIVTEITEHNFSFPEHDDEDKPDGGAGDRTKTATATIVTEHRPSDLAPERPTQEERPHRPAPSAESVFAQAKVNANDQPDVDESSAFLERVDEPGRPLPKSKGNERTVILESMTLADDFSGESIASSVGADPSGWQHATGLARPTSLQIKKAANRPRTQTAGWGRSTGVDSDDGPAVAKKGLNALAPFPSTQPGEDLDGTAQSEGVDSEAPDAVFAAPTNASTPNSNLASSDDVAQSDSNAHQTEIRDLDAGLTTSMTSEVVISQEAALKLRYAAERAMEEQREKARAAEEVARLKGPQIDPSDPWENKATLDGRTPVELPNALVGQSKKSDAPVISPAVNVNAQVHINEPFSIPQTEVTDDGNDRKAQPNANQRAKTEVLAELSASNRTVDSQLPPVSATESGAIVRSPKGKAIPVSKPNKRAIVLDAPDVPQGQSFADDDDDGGDTTSIARSRAAALKSQAGSIDVFRHVSEIAGNPAHVSRLGKPPVREPTIAGAPPQPSYELVSDEEKGVLVIEARAGATVFLDGIWRGVGRVVITELDRFGTYSVRVHCPGFGPWSGTVSLGGEVAARVRPTLTKR